VLRLMAAVIHSLWESQDGSLLIMPGTVPIGDSPVQFELTRYLEDNWIPVIEKDVDGPNSLPLEIDRTNTNLGRYSAARRVARTRSGWRSFGVSRRNATGGSSQACIALRMGRRTCRT